MQKVVCLFVHYYDRKGKFRGKSKMQDPSIRLEIVEKALLALKSIAFVDVFTCGYVASNLLKIDVDMCEYTQDPRLIMYEALCSLHKYRNDYDYFMVVEDDILVTPDIFHNVFDFDESGSLYKIFHPNRIEYGSNGKFCVDTDLTGSFTDQVMTFKGRELKVHENSHSGMLLVNQDKLDLIHEKVDQTYRGRFIGGYMASSFAHFHKPFQLFRVSDGLDFHSIEHLDPAEIYNPTLSQKFINRLLFRVSFFRSFSY